MNKPSVCVYCAHWALCGCGCRGGYCEIQQDDRDLADTCESWKERPEKSCETCGHWHEERSEDGRIHWFNHDRCKLDQHPGRNWQCVDWCDRSLLAEMNQGETSNGPQR